MIELDLIKLIVFFLVILQTMAGVGILVLGTPILLLINYNMIDILGTLLPISILTSFINLIYFKLKKKKLKLKMDSELKKYLFFACYPSIILGLIILKNFGDYINFNILVSVIIFSSVLFVIKFKKKIFKFEKNFKLLLLTLVGFIHGISNSGGTLLSLFVSALQKNSVNQSRYHTTYAYLFLALFQFLAFLTIFGLNFFQQDFKIVFVIIIVGILIGNILIKFIDEIIYKSLISVLAIISAIFLILKV